MNKIEKAISDCKLKIDQLQREKLIIVSQIDIMQDELANLQAIEKINSIPHIEESIHKPVKIEASNRVLD